MPFEPFSCRRRLFCANYLILVLDVDRPVFLPPDIAQAVPIERHQFVEFLLRTVGRAEQNRMVSHAGHQFDFRSAVVPFRYDNLDDLRTPEIVRFDELYKVKEFQEIFAVFAQLFLWQGVDKAVSIC